MPENDGYSADGYSLDHIEIVYVLRSLSAGISDRRLVLAMSPHEALEFLRRMEVQNAGIPAR